MRRDLIENNHFRTDANGRIVFFPWSLTGHGYLVPDAATKTSILRVLRTVYLSAIVSAMVVFSVASAGIEIAELSFLGFLRLVALSFLPALACIGLYGLWVARLIERLPPSDLRFSRSHLLAIAARQVEPGELRKAALVCLVFIAISVVAAWVEPNLWWLAVVVTVFFGGMAVLSLRMLRMRRRRLAGKLNDTCRS